MGKLQEYLSKKYGMPCDIRENPVTASVAAINTEILRNSADRLGYVVINLDAANTLYLYFEPVAAVPRGFILGAGGGGLAIDAERHGPLPGRRLLAGGSAYPVSIYIIEWFGVE